MRGSSFSIYLLYLLLKFKILLRIIMVNIFFLSIPLSLIALPTARSFT